MDPIIAGILACILILVVIAFLAHMPSLDAIGKSLAMTFFISMALIGYQLLLLSDEKNWMHVWEIIQRPGTILSYFGTTGILAYIFDILWKKNILQRPRPIIE